MPFEIDRRALLTGVGTTLLVPTGARAQGAGGLLAKLKAAKKVRVGIANQPPFSGLNPDGTLTGMAPTLAKAIMTRLGVPEMEATISTYGELVPGMQAGRWDFIAAALTITKQRCSQVLFSDPILFDGGSIVSLKSGGLADPPKLVAEIAQRKITVGVQAGGAHSRVLLAAGVDQTNMQQFTSDVSIIDGLVAKRIQVAFGSSSGLKNVIRQRNLDVVMTYPVPDDPAHGSACAFRLGDTDLYEAFSAQLTAMKASGEWIEIAKQNGFEIPNELRSRTAKALCESEH